MSREKIYSIPQDEEREERYKQIMNKYEPQERQLLTEIFGMIYALSSSVVYDNGVFNDYLGDLFIAIFQIDFSTVLLNMKTISGRLTLIALKIE